MRDASDWRRHLTFWKPDVGTAVDDELRFHLEMRERELVAAGRLPDAARLEAEREFGNVSAIRDACMTIDTRVQRRASRLEEIGSMLQDLKFAARGLRRTPGFTVTALLCIALGIAVTTMIFGAVNAVLLRPLPYEKPDQLVAVYVQNLEHNEHGVNISYPDYLSWRDASHSFSALGMWTWNTLTLSGEGEAERVEGAEVTANLFPLLGVHPILGRTFVESEERPGQTHVILLGYPLWKRRFGGNPRIVGSTVPVDGVPYTVVGVMPNHFSFPESGNAWVPLNTDPLRESRGNRYWAGAIGRLKPGVTLEQAQGELATISRRLEQDYPADNTGWAAEAITLRQDLTGDLRKPLLVFVGAVALVLLIACANVAGLMLARGAARQRETAIRAAIGAGRSRIVRQVLAESLVLAAAGGALGGVLGASGVQLFRYAFPGDVPYYITLGIDATSFAFAAILAALTAVLFGLVPALRATHVDLNVALREGSTRSGEGRSRSRLRSGIVIGEVALSVIVLVGAMLLIRSYRALQGTELGFTEKGVLTARVALPPSKYRGRERSLAFFEELLGRIRTIPGVVSVGSAEGIPFSGWNLQSYMYIEGRPQPKPNQGLDIHFQRITPDYFKSLGVQVIKGRGLTLTDRDSVAQVGVINETLASREFAGIDPIGKRIKFGGPDSTDPWITIVGVIRDFRHYRLPQPMGPAIYLPFAAQPTRSQTLTIQTSLADPLALVPAVRGALQSIDPDVPAYEIRTMEQQVTRSLWRQRLQGQVLGAFAVLALVLAAVGIYGVISYAVAQRSRELGVRMALGAPQSSVLGLVLAQGARLALVGIVLGLVAAFALTRLVQNLLYRVGPTDPLTFVGAPLILTLVTLLATYVPARRATRVDPLVAMRIE